MKKMFIFLLATISCFYLLTFCFRHNDQNEGSVRLRAGKVVQMARYNDSAAITEDGTLYVWGDSCSDTVPEKFMDNVVSVSLGGAHSAAVTTDGDLYTWGYNDNGQLGDGTNDDSSTPVKIMENVASVSLGEYNSAAITKDGTLYIWGDNAYGQFGNGKSDGDDLNFDEETDSNVPVKIMDDAAYVSIGGNHSAAITTNGSLYMWGDNYYGQLGNGGSGGSLGQFDKGIDNNKPMKIMDNVISVSLGYYHSAAITADGDLYVWGANYCGQLGNGTFEDSSTPVKIMEDVASVSLGGAHSAAITKSGSLYVWGYNVAGQLGNGEGGTDEDGRPLMSEEPIKIMDNAASVSLGDYHSAAITTDGSLYTWGDNYCGQLGNGSCGDEYMTFDEGTDSNVPVKIMDNAAY